MRNYFQLLFAILTIFIICISVSEAWENQRPNGQCSLPIAVGANGKCVSKDCDSSCHKKYKGTGRCQGNNFNQCMCFVCRRPRRPPRL
ncbi:hypothetical protein CARUB_v10016001mg [Capsella rubella]|uniref:Knottin scorpion toxin-like domain-containing protein n=1 Tax=Capsella rubella TaxID=81985 RepID=R0I868_9BRAS|nr:defensin-like protein 144 [Capsella rubella]EOA32703.1 hypothetical protein CARUB_v10016001mg [Capsella rubella]